MQGPARTQAILVARTQVFDVLGYTGSVDSGFSIDIVGYDLVIFRVDVRSVHAITLCQMMQRVRHLRDNKIIVLCESRAKDWELFPRYRSERQGTSEGMPGRIISTGTLADAMKSLMQSTEPVVFFRYKKNHRWRLTRQTPPHKATMQEALLSLMTPTTVHKIACGDGAQSSHAMMSAADAAYSKLIIENDIPQYRGLVTMMARDKMEEMNKARDMISTITDIALKQHATVENTFLCLADNEALIAKMIRAEREMLCTTRAKNITSAECLDMTKLRTIHRQQVSTDDERNALSRAYACATFGEEGI